MDSWWQNRVKDWQEVDRDGELGNRNQRNIVRQLLDIFLWILVVSFVDKFPSDVTKFLKKKLQLLIGTKQTKYSLLKRQKFTYLSVPYLSSLFYPLLTKNMFVPFFSSILTPHHPPVLPSPSLGVRFNQWFWNIKFSFEFMILYIYLIVDGLEVRH